MDYFYKFYLVLVLISFCKSISLDCESSDNSSCSIASKSIDFTGQYTSFCRTNINEGKECKTFELVLFAETTGFTQEENFALELPKIPYALMECNIPASGELVSNVTCILDAKQYYINEFYLPDEFPEISDCHISSWDKIPKQISTNCQQNYEIEFIMDEFSETIYNPKNNTIQGKGHVKNNPKNDTFSLFLNVLIDDSIRGKMNCVFSLIQKPNWSFNCSVSGKKSVLIYPTVSHDESNNEDIYINIYKNLSIKNYKLGTAALEFYAKKGSKCRGDVGVLYLYLYAKAYDVPYLSFNMYLESPNFCNMRCYGTPVVPVWGGELTITCEIDTYRHPIFSDMNLVLPKALPFIINNNWYVVPKYYDSFTCHSNDNEIQPYLVKGPECAMDNYNTFIFFVPNDFEIIQNKFSFNMFVFFNGKSWPIKCEFYQKKLINDSINSLFYCYVEGSGDISFYRTYMYIDKKYFLINYQHLKTITINKCVFTNKTIYFNYALQNCTKNYPNQVQSNIILYAKMSNFSSDYSFKIDLVNSAHAYLECYMPVVTKFQEFSHIDCALDRLKFPLLNEEIISLPKNLSIEDIDILNWDIIDKEYNISSSAPEYDLIFIPEEFKDPYCYKAYNNLFNVSGQISRGNSNNTRNLSDYYNFEINAIVDDKFTKFPCELKINNSLNNYELSCVVNGNYSVEIFDTIVVNNVTDNKDLIYINISHTYILEKCDPIKFISFKSINANCSSEQNKFNIYLFADMNGFSANEKIKLYLEKPSYIYMECSIPKTEKGSSDQYILCEIDTKKFPLIKYEIISLSNEFIIDPNYGIFNWDKIKKTLLTGKCSSNIDISFNPINFFDIECYSNGSNAFIVDGNLISNKILNINNKNINKFTLNAIIDSQYGNISCEIFSPDSSNIYSRIYCHSKVNIYVEIFPTFTNFDNSEENIYINISHKYINKICPESDKMIFIKSIDTECLTNISTLKLFIHSEIKGFSIEEKLKINMAEPKPYFIECIIPSSEEHSLIQCEMDTSKFPMIKYDNIIMPEELPNITDCVIINWNNINKIVSSGKCYKNYSLTFFSSVIIQPECYDKNYNSFIIKGNLDKKESFISNITQVYTFSLISVFNDNYFNTTLCDIYPPDATSNEFRIFCYTDKKDKIALFPTIVTDANTKENIYMNISNYNFDLLDCSSKDKIIYFKSINVNYDQKPLINIDINASISSVPQKEVFKIFLKEPNYSYMTCTLPSLENNSKDIKIECDFDTQKFPLIENKIMILPLNFPNVQGYSIANSDFNNKTLFINYFNPPYSILFEANNYIEANCYKIGLNVFSATGEIKIIDSDIYNNIYTFNNFMIIDGIYTFVSCKLFPSITIFDQYQMDCYTNGTLNATFFRTISIEQNIQKNIYINWNYDYLLKNCTEPVKKIIYFNEISNNECIPEKFPNNIFLNLDISANVSGFIEDEPVSFYLEDPSHFYMNCIVPFSRNGGKKNIIKCSLNALYFPTISIIKIVLPKDFPAIDGVEILNWDKMKLKVNNIKNCPEDYQLIFYDIKNNEQNCKSKNETMISLLGSLGDKYKYPLHEQYSYSFTLRSIINKEAKNISCEIYGSDKYKKYYQMDCNIIINDDLELHLYKAMVYDTLYNKYIYIDMNNSYQISECSKNNKFINFDGKTEMKFIQEKSLFELDIYSDIIGFEEEKKINFYLDYPKYSKMDCFIPSSNGINNTFIKCTMDMDLYPLINGDKIILPNNIFDKENCSLTKWDKVKKNITLNYSSVKYSILFSSKENQDITSCDDKGNNIITISGFTQINTNDNIYNFNITGIVDDELKNISCNLNITGGKGNEIKCSVNGQNLSQIFQTKGLDNEKNEEILIKIDNYLNYNLKYCPVSKTELILTIALPIAGVIIIIVIVLLIVRYKSKNSNDNAKKEIFQLTNMDLLET